jgi:hypothetical protein
VLQLKKQRRKSVGGKKGRISNSSGGKKSNSTRSKKTKIETTRKATETNTNRNHDPRNDFSIPVVSRKSRRSNFGRKRK